MEMNHMIQVTVDGAVLNYPLGTPYQAVVDKVQANYAHEILLVNRDGKLRELYKPMRRDCTLTMVTAAKNRAVRPTSAVRSS